MNYNFSPKIDWLQYSVLKTFKDQKNDTLTSVDLHRLPLCDKLLGALFCNVDGCYNDVIRKHMQSFIDTFIFKELRFKLSRSALITLGRSSAPGYQFVVDVDGKFKIFVPLRRPLESDSLNQIFPLIRGRNLVVSDGNVQSDWFIYNEFVGLSIVFTGTQISRSILKLSFEDFMITQKRMHLDFKIQRLDLALDSNIDFSVVYRKLYNNKGIRTPGIDIRTLRFDVNSSDNSGSIIAGKRGSTRYMRIYNKFAEQNGSAEHYPFMTVWSTVRSLNDMRNVECFPWTRLEFELRGNAALETFFHFLDCSTSSSIFDFFSTSFMIYNVSTDQQLKYFLGYNWDRLSLDSSWADFVSLNTNFVQLGELPCHKDFDPQALSNKYFRSQNAYKIARDTLSTMYMTSKLFGINFSDYAATGGAILNQNKVYRECLLHMEPDACLSSIDSKIFQSIQKIDKHASEYQYQMLTAKGIKSVFEDTSLALFEFFDDELPSIVLPVDDISDLVEFLNESDQNRHRYEFFERKIE